MAQYSQSSVSNTGQAPPTVSNVQNQNLQTLGNLPPQNFTPPTRQNSNFNPQVKPNFTSPIPSSNSSTKANSTQSGSSTKPTTSVVDDHQSPELLALSIYSKVFTAMTGMEVLDLPEDQRIPYLQNVQDYVEGYILDYFEKHFSPQDKMRLLAGQKYGGAGVYARFPDLYNKYQQAFSELISKL